MKLILFWKRPYAAKQKYIMNYVHGCLYVKDIINYFVNHGLENNAKLFILFSSI